MNPQPATEQPEGTVYMGIYEILGMSMDGWADSSGGLLLRQRPT